MRIPRNETKLTRFVREIREMAMLLACSSLITTVLVLAYYVRTH